MKKDLFEAFEVLDSKTDDLEKKFQDLKNIDERVDHAVEKRLGELKMILYFNLIVSIVLLFFVIGWLARAFGF
jgi:ABC-type uncharacterized transport system fused permease/ATPase subunit